MIKNEDGSITIARNKYYLGVGMCLAVGSIGFFLYQVFKKDTRNWAQPPADHTEHWIMLAISLVIFVFLIMRARDQRPGMVFNKTGLTYRIPWKNKGFITWAEVINTEVKITGNGKNEGRLLILHCLNSKTVRLTDQGMQITWGELRQLVDDHLKKYS